MSLRNCRLFRKLRKAHCAPNFLDLREELNAFVVRQIPRMQILDVCLEGIFYIWNVALRCGWSKACHFPAFSDGSVGASVLSHEYYGWSHMYEAIRWILITNLWCRTVPMRRLSLLTGIGAEPLHLRRSVSSHRLPFRRCLNRGTFSRKFGGIWRHRSGISIELDLNLVLNELWICGWIHPWPYEALSFLSLKELKPV